MHLPIQVAGTNRFTAIGPTAGDRQSARRGATIILSP
jgi:hypothetical protein